MLKPKNFKYLSIFFILAYNSNFQTTGDSDISQKFSKEKIDKIIEASKDVLKNIDPKKICTDIRKKRYEKARADHKKLIDDIKNQNTVLVNFLGVFAIYKGDIARGACLTLDIMAEKALFDKIINLKIEHILQSIKKDSKQLQEILEKAESDQDESVKNKNNKSSREPYKLSDSEKELVKYISNNHKAIKYNPFKLALLPNIGLNLIKARIFNYIESKLRMDSKVYGNATLFGNNMIFSKEWWSAYEKDDSGQLKAMKTIPFSIVNLFINFVNPTYIQERTMAHSTKDLFESLNKFFNLGVPKFMFSRSAKIMSSIGSTGLSIKIADNILDQYWSNYAVTHHKHFLDLIKKYNSIDKITDRNYKNKLDEIEKELKEFITDSIKHNLIEFLFSNNIWSRIKSMGSQPFKCAVAAPVLFLLARKAYNFYKTNLR